MQQTERFQEEVTPSNKITNKTFNKISWKNVDRGLKRNILSTKCKNILPKPML